MDDDWHKKKAKVVFGIPINPQYMDGIIRAGAVRDRYGNKLSFKDSSFLHRYRRELRNKWRSTSKIIEDKDYE